MYPDASPARSAPPVRAAGVPWPGEPDPESYAGALLALARRDDRVVVLTAENRAAIRALPPLLDRRFVDVGIAEQTLVGAAAGLALRGRRPVCHALATFLTLRAFEFVRDDLGIPGLPAVLVGGVPGFLSEANGPTHQAIDDVAAMRAIPGMQIVSPADERELCEALPELVESGRPTYLRHVGLAPAFSRPHAFTLGAASVLRDGDDVGILSHGLLSRECHRAADLLAEDGYSVRLVHLPTLQPIDEAAVQDTLATCRITFTVEDHLLAGGLFGIVAELVARRGWTVRRLVPLALDARWFRPLLLAELLEHEGFSAARLAARMKEAACRQVAP